jgi:hypothetical protein
MRKFLSGIWTKFITGLEDPILDSDAVNFKTHKAHVNSTTAHSASAVGLSNVTNDAQLKIASNLSDVLDRQTSLNNITAVSSATNEYVLTKDTASGNAVFKAPIQTGHTIQNEGISLTARENLNFVGFGVDVTDDGINNSTVVTINGVQPIEGYTISNFNIDKTLDANSTSLDEVADVLSTLIDDLQNGYSGSSRETFETISLNLKSYPKNLNYTNNILTSILFTLPNGTITKTFNYIDGVLSTVVLSGDILGTNLTKSLSYTNNNLTSITYS